MDTSTTKPFKRHIGCLILLLSIGIHAVGGQTVWRNRITADVVVADAKYYLGVPYRMGGKGPDAFDCAGFTKFIFSHIGVTLSNSAAPQSSEGKKVKRDDLRKGDLVFFGDKHNPHRIGHVGIVTEVRKNKFFFIHAANSGITISESDDPYYARLYLGACRPVSFED